MTGTVVPDRRQQRRLETIEQVPAMWRAHHDDDRTRIPDGARRRARR